MASHKDYLDFVLDQLSELDGISFRPMMGEYVLYFRGKVVGGIYDDRFLVKPTPAARAKMPAAPLEKPYPGAKDMLLVEEIDDRRFLVDLILAMDADLAPPSRRRRDGNRGAGGKRRFPGNPDS